MKTPTLLVQLCAAAVFAAPLSLLGSMNEETINELKLTKFVEPTFPEGLRLEGVAEGNVTVAVSRNSAGEPVDILVLESTHPKLAAVAAEAVRQWRFAPTSDQADLSPRIIRIGFRLEGVVMVFPFGKTHEEEFIKETNSLSLRAVVSIPRLHSLRQVPKALAQPMPAYPASLAAKGLEGKVSLRFFVDEEGRVRLPEVVEATAPEFAEAAVAAVSQWRYETPRKGGRAIVACDHWAFKFQPAN